MLQTIKKEILIKAKSISLTAAHHTYIMYPFVLKGYAEHGVCHSTQRYRLIAENVMICSK